MTETTGNVADLVTEAARRGPEHLALVDVATSVSLTWAQVETAVDVAARTLLDAGLEAGDRVAVRLPTSTAFCIAVFGVLRAGGVVVPTSPDLPALGLGELLRHSGARLLFGEHGVDGVITLPPPGAQDSAEPVAPVGGGEDLAVLSYTSGTSGQPRGVMLSHRALLSNVQQCAALRPAPVTAADRVLLALPLYHVYGLGPGLLQVAAKGATAVLLTRFGPEQALATMEEHRVTTVVGVPPMYAALLSLPEERVRDGLSTVRLLTSGAAPLEESLLAEMQRIGGLPVFEGYGLTESGPVVTSTLVAGQSKAGSVGRPLPGVEVRLVDSDGDPLPGPDDDDDLIDDEREGTGLVAVRGANLFSGYWPDGAHGPDAEGWFRTGDVGYLDTDGDLHLVDRANDLIIVNGFNVYPHEVEHVLAKLDGVLDAAVVGVPSDRTGETVKAVLVLGEDVTLSEEDVLAHCAQRLAKFKVPTVVEFAEQLPHSVTGKISRALLRTT